MGASTAREGGSANREALILVEWEQSTPSHIHAIPPPRVSPSAFALASVLASCAESTAGLAESFQSIVEHEERHLAFELPGRVERVLLHRGASVAPDAPFAELPEGEALSAALGIGIDEGDWQ